MLALDYLSQHPQPSELQTILKDWDKLLDDKFIELGIDQLLELRSDMIDKLLSQLWQQHDLVQEPLSLNAVGGYGRRTLHPHSDVDISVIFNGELSASQQQKVQAFLTQLWDLGLDLGHSVRSLQQCEQEAQKDVVTATNLLDIRNICGDPSHAESVLQLLYQEALYSSQQFFEAKTEEQHQRHLKYRDVNFSMQPNLKNSPGGLRDIQTLIWIARKHFQLDDWQQLPETGYCSEDELAELLECQYFIWRVRWALHKCAKRGENRLLFDYQAQVAQLMGFGDTGNVAIEKMMRQLFRAMKRVRELNQMLLLFFQQRVLEQWAPAGSIINDQFAINGGLIHARKSTIFIERKNIIKLFLLIAQHPQEIKGISPDTLRMLRQTRRRLLGDLQDFDECRKLFVKLFQTPGAMGLAITLMHRFGMLSAYLPQWRNVIGQMQFDLYHAYTVDEHTYRLLNKLHEFETQQVEKSQSLAASIYRNMDNKLPLRIGALFHDIAKGRGGDHSELGAVDVEHFAKLHQLRESETNTVRWLVENHLLMSVTAQRQDIYDPEVIKTFAKQVGTQWRLDNLYCLTVADINATNDNLWNDWRASLIRKLYYSTKRALRDGLENVREVRTLVRENKAEALQHIAELSQSDEYLDSDIQQLWKRLPLSFFTSCEPQEIARYTDKILQQPQQAIITVDKHLVKGCNEVFVYMPDQKGLFVALFKTLSSLNVSVHDAQIALTKDGQVLETLKILDYDDNPITDPFRLSQIEDRLRQVLLEGQPLPTPSKPRHLRAFDNSTSVEFINSRKKDRSLLCVNALDNPQLMEKICSAFRTLEINIHSAKISTIGEMTDNVFLLSSRENKALSDDEKKGLVEVLLSDVY